MRIFASEARGASGPKSKNPAKTVTGLQKPKAKQKWAGETPCVSPSVAADYLGLPPMWSLSNSSLMIRSLQNVDGVTEGSNRRLAGLVRV